MLSSKEKEELKMEKMVKLVALDGDTLEPLYNVDEDGNPTLDTPLIPLGKALAYQKEAYVYQDRLITGWRNEFIIEGI